MTTKIFNSLDVATVLTGIAMRKGFTVSLAQEIASHLLGYDIYTHELVHEPTQDAYTEEGYRQFPDMPRRDAVHADLNAATSQVLAAYGPKVTVARGNHVRREHPLDTLRVIVGPDKPIIAITTMED